MHNGEIFENRNDLNKVMVFDFGNVLLTPESIEEVRVLSESIKAQYTRESETSVTAIEIQLADDSSVSGVELRGEDWTRAKDTGPEDNGTSSWANGISLEPTADTAQFIAKAAELGGHLGVMVWIKQFGTAYYQIERTLQFKRLR